MSACVQCECVRQTESVSHRPNGFVHAAQSAQLTVTLARFLKDYRNTTLGHSRYYGFRVGIKLYAASFGGFFERMQDNFACLVMENADRMGSLATAIVGPSNISGQNILRAL